MIDSVKQIPTRFLPGAPTWVRILIALVGLVFSAILVIILVAIAHPLYVLTGWLLALLVPICLWFDWFRLRTRLIRVVPFLGMAARWILVTVTLLLLGGAWIGGVATFTQNRPSAFDAVPTSTANPTVAIVQAVPSATTIQMLTPIQPTSTSLPPTPAPIETPIPLPPTPTSTEVISPTPVLPTETPTTTPTLSPTPLLLTSTPTVTPTLALPTVTPTPSITSTPLPPTATPKPLPPTATPKPQMPQAVTDYIIFMARQGDDASFEMDKLSEVIEDFTDDPLVYFDDDWKIKTVLTLAMIKTTGQAMQGYNNVPTVCRKLDSFMMSIGKDMVYISTEMYAGLDKLDDKRIANAAARMNGLPAKIKEATKEIGVIGARYSQP